MIDDETVLNQWYAVGALDEFAPGRARGTTLLDMPVAVVVGAEGTARAWRRDVAMVSPSDRGVQPGDEYPCRVQYGLVWVTLGHPAHGIPRFAECEEGDRFVVTGGAIGVHVSGLRAVENFLDMAHFPFVHTNWLGVEPHTEVRDYQVETTSEGHVLATRCRFYQPLASPTSTGGEDVDYEYRVVNPYLVVLYKTNPVQAPRRDFIALCVQPVGEEKCIAHSLLAYLKEGLDEPMVRWFMQLIFAQDKPILENQNPKRLPLSPRAEMSGRADASSIAYRRWLTASNVRYGAILAE